MHHLCSYIQPPAGAAPQFGISIAECQVAGSSKNRQWFVGLFGGSGLDDEGISAVTHVLRPALFHHNHRPQNTPQITSMETTLSPLSDCERAVLPPAHALSLYLSAARQGFGNSSPLHASALKVPNCSKCVPLLVLGQHPLGGHTAAGHAASHPYC